MPISLGILTMTTYVWEFSYSGLRKRNLRLRWQPVNRCPESYCHSMSDRLIMVSVL